MGVFVSSASAAGKPGVFAILVSPPRTIRGISLGYVGYVAQFDAGPSNVGYLPQDGDDLVQTYEPKGVPRKKSGWYGLIGQLSAPWFIVRVNGGSAGIPAPSALTANVTGTPGAATVSWVITALNASGETVASQTITVTTANATLSSSPVQLAWAAVPGATGYSVYRTVGGPSQGRIATNQAGVTLTDNGIAGGGQTAPATNGTGYVSSQLELLGTGGSVVFTAKSPGVWANQVSVQTLAASDGVANHRDIVVTLTDPITKQTQETYRNVALTQNMAALLLNSRLLASITWTGTITVWPTNGTSNMTGGSDGATPIAADYTAAIDQLALSGNVRVVVTDDCGDSIRGAVQAYVQTHCTNLYNRVGHLHGIKTNTQAQVLTDKANYTNETCTYYGAWVQVYDDSGTTLVDVPLSIFGAVIRANIPVHWSIANHDTQATKYLQNIKGVSTATTFSVSSDTVQTTMTTNQVVIPIQGVGPQPGTTGPWQLLHGRSCNLNSGYIWEVTTWYRIYLVTALAPQLDPYVNGPNDLATGQEIQAIINAWLEGEVALKHLSTSLGPDGVTILPPYSTDIFGVNTGTSMANGDFYISIDGHTPGVRERLILMLNVGETVSVRRQSN